MPIKKKKYKALPVAYDIHVNVDRNGNFTYKANGKDASKLPLQLGDTISWSAKLRGRKTAFQVEFPAIAPFGVGGRVFRSAGKPTPPQTVVLLPHYQGNLIFKYTVTVSNSWYDDPVIGPVSGDPLEGQGVKAQTILLSADNNGVLTITSPPMPLAKGPVTWQWDPQSAYTDDFVLTFDKPVVTGWPPVTNSQAQTIVLNLQAVGTDRYTINTVNTGLTAPSSLTIA
jgi:hypothetical protein